ncbi:MAG: ABC transporter ATP-binding protein [Candidatus Margulisiibacteriota bacterium]
MGEYNRLFKYLRPYLPQIVVTWFCTILVTATTLLLAPLAGYAFQAIGDKNLGSLNLAVLGVIGLYVLKGLFTYGQEYLSYLVSNRVIVDLRVRLYEHLQELSLDFYGRWHTGELLSRMMNDIANLQLTILTSFTAIIPQSLLLIGLLVYIFVLNWQLSLLMLVAFPLIVQLMRWFASGLRQISERVQQKTADITAHVQETVSQIRVVKAFTMEKAETEKFRAENAKALKITMGAVQILSTQSPVIALLQATAAVGIVWLGGLQIINGQLTLPQLISFATALGIMTDPGSTLSKAFAVIQQGLASSKRIFEIIDTVPSVADRPGAQPLREIVGRIEFQHVTFAYDREPVLNHIDLDVKAGEALALVGRTGSGKSTLVNLLPRFYDPRAGRILIDGVDLRDVTSESLRKKIAIVPQEIALFRGTIEDNIAYGKPDATCDQIQAAAKAANAHQFISALPNGYLTEVGERGAKLSGGEKQRIAIARAVLRDPKILILDEATSSLDAETEALIREALDKLMKGRTTFIIAHRLYTVEHVDRVIVLDGGRIVEQGNHRELLAKGGLYQKLYELQLQNKG